MAFSASALLIFKSAIFTVPDQQLPLVQRVVDRFPGQAVFRHSAAVRLLASLSDHPVPGGSVVWRMLCLLFWLRSLIRASMTIQFADLANGHIGLADFAAFLFGRRGLAGLYKLPACMIPTANAGDVVFTTDLRCTRYTHRPGARPRSHPAGARAPSSLREASYSNSTTG